MTSPKSSAFTASQSVLPMNLELEACGLKGVSLLTGWVPRTHSSSSTFATSSVRHSSAQTLAISTRMAAFARSWSSASTGRGSTSDW